MVHTDSDQPINIVGAGLAGALLSVMLVRHGCGALRLWDRRPDPRRVRTERGRSINLALAARGIKAHLIGGADTAEELDAVRAIDQATRLAITL